MSEVTILPTGTGSNTGALTGGATAHAVLADSDTGTFVEYDVDESSALTFADVSIPADAEITSIVLYAQVAKVATTAEMQFVGIIPAPHADIFNTRTFSYAGPTTITVPLTLPPGVEDAHIDGFTVYVVNKGSDARLYRLAAVVHYTTVPTLTVDSPTGTLADRNIITVGWTPTFDGTPGIGGTDYEVKIFDDATYGGGGFDPDTSTPVLEALEDSNATSHTFTEPLANDTYRAYVRVSHETANGEELWSDWDYEDFVVDVDFPAEPTLTLTPIDDEAHIAVVLAANAGDATTDWFEVQRWTGTEWLAVRTQNEDGTITNSLGDGGTLDYEARNGVEESYRARAVHDYGDGNTAASAWVTDTASWSSEQWWIKHPTLPSMNAPITLRSNPGYSRTPRVGIHQAIGATYPIAVTDSPGSKQGEMVVLGSLADDTHDDLEALMEAGVPLLWQGPPSNHQEDRWVVLTGFGSNRLADKGWIADVDDSLPWTQVGRPTDAELVVFGLYPADELYPSEDLFPGP